MVGRSAWNKTGQRARMAACVCLVPLAAVAQEDFAFAPEATEACLAAQAEGNDPRSCFGLAANSCMQDNEGGESTVGMSSCLGLELDWWDGRLNAAFVQIRESTTAIDAEMAELGSAVESQTDALVAMQRAWIAYRDASCHFEMTKWGGGTGGGPAYLTCALVLTADQALRLEADVADGY